MSSSSSHSDSEFSDIEFLDFDNLDQDNYWVWKRRMKAQLRMYHLWKFVDGSAPCPVLDESSLERKRSSEREIERWNREDARAKLFIIQKMSDSQLLSITKCDSAKEVWDELRRIHEETGVARKVFSIMRDMRTRTYVEGTPVMEHISAFKADYMRLQDYKRDIGDEMLAILILLSFPPSEELSSLHLLNWDCTGKLGSKEVISSLRDWEAIQSRTPQQYTIAQ